ncbi:hypothetical protein [Microlunatus ginsengisoli]|uniref:Uncharacterized protein n=1 Tax=Microlunatus ginsengisoli TaxID=363863 RepID=A0ABP7A1I0_9ACTN
MSFLRKLFKRDAAEEEDDSPIVLDKESVAPRLLRLEKALDAVATEMRSDQSMDNPGWRGRVNEYSQLAGDCMQVRRGSTVTREAVLDIVFAVRPVFSGPIPEGLEGLGPLQAEMMAAAEDLRA